MPVVRTRSAFSASCRGVVGVIAGGVLAAALIAADGGPLVPKPVSAGEPTDPFARTACGDAAGVVSSLAEGYAKGTLTPWIARLYQDLRLEAGERAALYAEATKTWAEPRQPLQAWLVARLCERKEIDAALARVLSAAPEPAAVLLDQGWAALAADHHSTASSIVGRLRKLAGDREETALLEARVAHAQGDPEAAERSLAAFSAAHPDAEEARRDWAEVLLVLRRRGDAVAVLDEGLHRGRSPALLVSRAWVALALGDRDLAKSCLDEVKDRGRPALRAEALAARSALLLCARDGKGALAAADDAMKASPVSVIAMRAKARALEFDGKTVEALALLDDAIEARPAWSRLHADRGALLVRMRRLKDARKAFADAKRRDPDDVETQLGLGAIEEESADWSTAERIYRSVIKADPECREAHRRLAGVVYFLGKIEQADVEAGWLLERDGKDAAAWYMRGRVAYKQDHWDDAHTAFDKAIAADPTYGQAWMGKGWTFEQQDKRDEAKKAYESGIAADPRLPLVHRYLAELLEDMNDAKGALDHYKAYLDLGGADPDEDVRHSVERLSK